MNKAASLKSRYSHSPTEEKKNHCDIIMPELEKKKKMGTAEILIFICLLDISISIYIKDCYMKDLKSYP